VTGDAILHPRIELDSTISSNASSPHQTVSEAGSEDLPCPWCHSHGSFAGVTVDQRVCISCSGSGLRDDVGIQLLTGAPRNSVVESRERPPGEVDDNNAPLDLEVPADLPSDLSSPSMGAPVTISSAHRGTLGPFLAARREHSNIARGDGRVAVGSVLGAFLENGAAGASLHIQHVPGFDLDGPPQRRRRLNPMEDNEKE
jgi:hypothetical protein